MPKKKKTEAVMVDGIPIKPISPAEHMRLARPSFFIPRIPTLRSSRYGKDSGSLRHLSSC